MIEGRERAFGLLGAVTIAFSSILVRLSHASPSTAAIFRCAYALPALGLLATMEDRRLGRRSWASRRPSLLAGLFFAADLLLWHNSIADVGAGLSTVLANIQVVLVPLVAWVLLSEPPPRRLLAALPVAGAGVVLISGVLEHSPYGRAPTAGTLFGLGAGIAYVGFLLLLRRGGADRAEDPRVAAPAPGRGPVHPAAAAPGRGPVHPAAGPLFDATVVATVICVLAGLVIGDARLVPTWPGAGWLVLLAFSSQVLGWLLISSTLPRLPAAMTSVILCVQPLGTVALAALIFGESPSPLQLLGVGLVLAALLTAGRAVRRTEPAATPVPRRDPGGGSDPSAQRPCQTGRRA